MNQKSNGIRTRPTRRMTQAELDSFLGKAADILRGNVDHSEFRGYVFALLFFKRISDVYLEEIRILTKKLGDEELIRAFASKAGKSSGEFYTPKEVAYLMAQIVGPKPGHHVCDWASGSAGLLLQCRRYVNKHHKQRANELFLYAQESNVATYNI